MTDPRVTPGAITPSAIKTIYRGRILTLQIESITLPSGHALEAEIIRHPGSVVIVPVHEDGGIILVRQYRHALGRHVWELPAGSLKPGEPVEGAAGRECQEEIGLIPAALDYLGAYYPTPGYCDEKMHFFRATGLRIPGTTDAQARPDEDEDIETGTFDHDAIRAMMAAGEIVDLKTIGGLALLP
jgi:ADP-ribose pyrophosphatase